MDNKLVFGATTLTQYNWDKYELLADYTYYWKVHIAIAEYLYTHYWSKNEVVNNGYAWHRYNLHDAPITEYCYGVYKRITERDLLQTGNFPSNFLNQRIGYSIPDTMEKYNIGYFTVGDYYNLFGEYPVQYYMPPGTVIECYPVMITALKITYHYPEHIIWVNDDGSYTFDGVPRDSGINYGENVPWVRLLVPKSVYDYISMNIATGGLAYNDRITMGGQGTAYTYRKGNKTLSTRVFAMPDGGDSVPVHIRNNDFVEAENGAYRIKTNVGEGYYKWIGYGLGHYVPAVNYNNRSTMWYEEHRNGDYDYVIATEPQFEYVGVGGTHNLSNKESSTSLEFYYDNVPEYDRTYSLLMDDTNDTFNYSFYYTPILTSASLPNLIRYEPRYLPPTKYVFNTTYTPANTFYSNVPDYFDYYKYWREGAEWGKPTLRYTGTKPIFDYTSGYTYYDGRIYTVNNGYMNNNQFYPTCVYMDENREYSNENVFSICEGVHYQEKNIQNNMYMDAYVAILQPSGNSTVIGLVKYQIVDEVISNSSNTYIKEGIDGNYYYEFYGAISTLYAYDYYHSIRDKHIISYIGENDTKLINDGYVYQSKTQTEDFALQQIDIVSSHNYYDYPQNGMKGDYFYIHTRTEAIITGYHKGTATGEIATNSEYEIYPEEGYKDGYWYSYDKYTVVYRKGEFIESIFSFIETAYPQDNYIINRYWYVATGSEQIQVPELEINNTLLMGGVNYTQEINPSEDLQIGTPGAAQIDFTIFAPDASAATQYLGKDFVYYVKMNSDNDWRQIGTFTLTKAELPDKQTAKIQGFDYIYKFDTIIDEWLDEQTFPMTLGDMFASLCEYVGCEAYSTDFTNSDFMVNDNFEAVQITGRTILQYITEASGGFCVAEPDGRIHLKHYAIPPTGAVNLGNNSYRKYTHEIYNVPVISSVVVRKDDDDEGVESNV